MYLKDNITRLAIIAFEKQGSLSISQYGELKKVYLNAYCKNGSTDINPPNEQIYFYNNIHSECDENLVKLVKILKFCSGEEAIGLVKEWEDAWVNDLEENPFVLGHFGSFQKNKGKIDFYPRNKTFYDYLPVVKSNYEGKFNIQLPGSSYGKGTVIEEVKSSGRKSILVPTLWTILLVFFGIALFFWRGPLSQIFDQVDNPEKKLVNVAPKSYGDTENLEYFSDTNESYISEGDSQQNLNGTTNRNEDYNLSKESPDPDELSKETLPEVKQCTLIVGAFANQGNVEKMKERLSGMDLVPVVLERNTLTLVGAKLKCSDSEQKVSEIRSKVEPNAWMYKN